MAAIEEAVTSLESLLKNLGSDEIELVVNTLKKLKEQKNPSDDDPEIQLLVGRTYTPREKIELEIQTLFRYFERRRQLLEGSLTAPQVATLLGTSRQTPHDRMKSQTLLGILEQGSYRFPIWQFDPEGPDGVIDGLPEVLKSLKVSNFVKLNWLVRPNPFLDNLTPVEALKKGDKERVIKEAFSVGVR